MGESNHSAYMDETSIVAFDGNLRVGVPTSLDVVVGGATQKINSVSYRLASIMSMRRTRWFGKSTDTIQQEWAIACQSAICYNQIMSANSRIWNSTISLGGEESLNELWCPCIIPHNLVTPEMMLDVRDAINALYAKDLRLKSDSDLCNEYIYHREHGLVAFYLRTNSPIEFVHKYDNVPSAPPLTPSIETLGIKADDGVEILQSAIYTIHWKDKMDSLALENPPKGFFVLPLSDSLIKDASKQTATNPADFNEVVKAVLYHLGRAQAILKDQPLPLSFSDYIIEYGINQASVRDYQNTIRGYYREIILPLFNASPKSFTAMTGSKLIHWTNKVFSCFIFYTEKPFLDQFDGSLSPHPAGTLLPQRIFDSQYRVSGV